MAMTEHKLERGFFYLFVVLFPVIDFLNGLFLSYGIPIPLGVVYRLFFALLLVIGAFAKRLEATPLTVLTLTFLIGNTVIFIGQHLVLQNSWSFIIADLSVLIKYFLWVLIAFYVYQYRDSFQQTTYMNLFIILSVLFTVLLLIPYLMGVGNQTYGNSNAGYKGFFFANNDTSIAFMVSITMTTRQLVTSFKDKKFMPSVGLLVLFFGNIICLLLVGTKTGILYGGFVSLLLLGYVLFVVDYPSVSLRLGVWLTVSVLACLLFFKGMPFIIQTVSGTYQRIIYFYHLYDGDLIRLISSSRSDFLAGGYRGFSTSPHGIATALLGQGFEYRLSQFGRFGLIEMDAFDLLFGLGYLGVFF